MLKRAAAVVVILAIAAGALFWFLTAPEPLAAAALPSHEVDPDNGALIFYAGGCASCHADPDAEGDDKLALGGGLELNTPFGLFRVPNISPDPETGIGGWSTLEFVNAVKRGVSPGGRHYYPAFPYASYAKMTFEDIIDLKAFMDTLPPVSNQVADHELSFPYNIRRSLGLWKRLYVDEGPVLALADASESVRRGQYLVEGPGHCGECHTPRDMMGGMKADQWLAGARNPEGRGRFPNITPEGLDWSAEQIADALKTGFTPEFDTFGGAMASVQEELSHLPDEDLLAIGAYLKAVPPLPDAVPREEDGES